MKFFIKTLILLMIVSMPLGGLAQEEATTIEPMLSSEPVAKETNSSKVTAVYGVTADDYLPSVEVAKQHLRPNVRKAASHPGFDLPDAFYFIGGPIFLLILLRVLVIFLNGFEEKRKEEQRAAASENVHPEESSLR